MEKGKNANPTILSPSDLPTRKRRTSTDNAMTNALGIFSYPPQAYSSDPFANSAHSDALSDSDAESESEPIDEQEIYDLIATMSDPEHPISLGSLAVISLSDI